MKDHNWKTSTSLISAFVISFMFVCACSDRGPHGHDLHDAEFAPKVAQANEFAVSPPPFTDGIFPCTDCHIDIEPNPERRALVDMHDDIDAIFNHDSDNRWCLDCHDINSRDSLRTASGKLLGFDESYKLCGQCHGDKLRDWKVGVHGQRTGQWNGEKQYLLCVHCHDPHAPRFEKLEPMPPPVKQEELDNHALLEEQPDSLGTEEITE